MRIKRINRYFAITVIIALTVALVFGAGLAIFSRGTRSLAKDTEEFVPKSLEIANSDFSSTSGSYPATPDSWTGGYVGDGSGNIVSGVVDLTPSVYSGSDGGNKKFKLDQYPEYASESNIPRTIFDNSIDYPDVDAKTLLINTASGAKTAYAYSSATIALSPNSFYRFSVWVKTGDFASDTGATIKLAGLGEDLAFRNINTVSKLEKVDNTPKLTKENDFGWAKYTLYVHTPSASSKSVTLSLGIGDAYVDETDKDTEMFGAVTTPASGYAFFDNIVAQQISAYDFAYDTRYFTESAARDGFYTGNNGTAIALDMFGLNYLTDSSSNEIGTFSDNNESWEMNAVYDADAEDTEYAGPSNAFIYDSFRVLDPADNTYGFTSNPWAPLGRAEGYNGIQTPMGFAGSNGNILAISTYNSVKKEFESAARGVTSPDYTVSRFGYYRFGVWVKDENITDGNGISIAVKGQANNTANDNKLNQWYNELTGDPDDAAHYGWKEHTVYIKGSVLSDLTIHFELWLGTPDSKSSGIALFDNVTFTELTYSEYTEMSAENGAQILSLDAEVPSTGITNGSFMNVGDYDALEYPLPVADWKYHTTDTVTSLGFSSVKVDTDDAVYGIIPTDAATFNSIVTNTSKLAGIPNPASFANPPLYNVALLSSKTKTAFCYQSSGFTVSTDKANKIAVDLAVTGVSEDSYGASLVLKTSDGAVVSTIERITTTNNAFRTYTFYIDAPLSDSTVLVEVWLGMNDRKNNSLKLSDGTVFVKEVRAEEWTAGEDSTIEAEYKEIRDKYTEAIKNPSLVKNLDYGVFSFKDPSLDYYDVYSYNMFKAYATPYMWNTASTNANSIVGVFSASNMRGLSPYSGYKNGDETGNMLLINNTDFNRTEVSYGNTLKLVANTYYRLDVKVKVHITDELRDNDNVVGANIGLTGTVTDTFKNIKDTSTLVSQGNEESRDSETFKTYTFFISTGAAGGDLGLTISFGGDTKASLIQGQLVIGDVSLTSINNTTYESAKKDLDEQYQKAVELSEATSDDEEPETEDQPNDIAWWIIPTVIFSACLVAAILIIIIIRIVDHRKKKKKTTYSTEYDRSSVIKDIDKLKEDDEKRAAEAENKELQEPAPEGKDSEEENSEEAEQTEQAEQSEATDQSTEDKAEETTEKSDDKDDKKPSYDDLDD